MYMKPGYVLPTTLMILSIAIAMLTSVMQRSFLYQDRARFEVNSQRLRLLTMSGIQIAIAQTSLILPEEPKENQGTKKVENEMSPAQKHIVQLMPIINKWQTFKLTEAADGIDGTIQLYITCETGKINLGQLATAVTQKNDPKKIQAEQPAKNQASKNNVGATPQNWQDTIIKLVEQAGITGFGSALKTFKEKNGRSPDDATELLTQDAIKAFKTNLFLSQPEKSILKSPIYLMDLFTTSTQTERLNPWFLSGSVATLLGLKRNVEKINLKEKIKEIKPFMNWQQQWNKILEPLYGKKFEAIPKEIASLFAASFDASVCSVICYAQIQNATQKIYAIIEKVNPPSGISSKSVVFKIKRLYWL